MQNAGLDEAQDGRKMFFFVRFFSLSFPSSFL